MRLSGLPGEGAEEEEEEEEEVVGGCGGSGLWRTSYVECVGVVVWGGQM